MTTSGRGRTPKPSVSSKKTSAPSSPSPMSVQDAGRKGGQAVKEKYGSDFYAQIGQKGGETVQAKAKRYRELKESGQL